MRSVVFKFCIKLCFGRCIGRNGFRYLLFLIASQLGTNFKLVFKAKEIADSFVKKFFTLAAVILDSYAVANYHLLTNVTQYSFMLVTSFYAH